MAAVPGRATSCVHRRVGRWHLVAPGETVTVRCRGGRPLTARGLAAAVETAEALRSAPVDAVWCSGGLACRQTAELIAARHGLPVRSRGSAGRSGGAESGELVLVVEPAVVAQILAVSAAGRVR